MNADEKRETNAPSIHHVLLIVLFFVDGRRELHVASAGSS